MKILALIFGFAFTVCAFASQQDTTPRSASQAQSSPVQDSTTLERIKYEPPIYPMGAREKGLQGEVRLRLEISETGDVQKVDVISGEPIFAQAAVLAAKKWRFKPYIRGGKPIRVFTETPVDFAFAGNVRDVNAPGDVGPPQSPSPSAAETPKRVVIAQGTASGFLIRNVTPVYPLEARRKRIMGTVLLHAVINKKGEIEKLTPISGPRELIPAAVGAVEQWKYRPYVLNGEPVEVDTTITVNFQMH